MKRKTNQTTANEALTKAALSRPALPPLPDLPKVTSALRDLNENADGPDTVWLYCHGAGFPEAAWCVGGWPHDWPHAEHSEDLPGDGKPLDAVAAARRLLAEARLAGFR